MNIYVKEALLCVVPYIEMAIWFSVIYFLGGFSTSFAPLFALLVLASFAIDNWALSYIKKHFRVIKE